jgi:hypothetical protein
MHGQPIIKILVCVLSVKTQAPDSVLNVTFDKTQNKLSLMDL